MQIKKKLPIIFNILICIPLGILAIVTYLYLSNMAVAKSKSIVNRLAVSEGRALVSLMEAKKYQVKLLASDEKVIRYMELLEDEVSKEQVKRYLKEALGQDDDYEILLLDRTGHLVLSTNEIVDGTRLRSKESFEKVMQGEESFSDMVFSFIENNKAINITVPITNGEGETLGALCKIIYNRSFSEFADTVEVDESGYAFIIDERGYIVAHPNESLESTFLPNEELRKEVENTRKEGKIKGACTYVFGNQKKYASYYIVQGINWVICVTQAVEEMQRQAFMGSLLIVGVMIMLIIAISIVSRRITCYITGPIDMLMATMNNVAEGDFTRYCTYSGDDEFGVLSKNYNEMLRKLGESHSYLNEVCSELAVTKQKLEHNYSVLKASKKHLH